MKAFGKADTACMKSRAVVVFAIMLFFGVLFPNTVLRAVEPEEKISVLVSILPQVYFVERVGGQRVDVTVLVGPSQSPHTFEPSPRQMAEISNARVFFRIGADFEEGLIPKLTGMYPNLDIVDTRENITLLTRSQHHRHGEHDHDREYNDDHHAHSGHGNGPEEQGTPDPHIWLDPKRVMIQAVTVARNLVRFDPANAQTYEENLKEFQKDLARLDRDIAQSLAPYQGNRFFVFHPAFGYFADSYGLIQVAIEIEGKEPGARQLATLIREAKTQGVKVIFVQPQFSQKNAEAVAREIGGAVVPINPLPREYQLELGTMAQTIREGLSKQ
ncbi:MAG: zinc ABC transporter substrate-binding protein [Desulfomonilia bacterium]|nr:zinc ABC transporter substrate-binding protein [Desulfomonilia bacterium]